MTVFWIVAAVVVAYTLSLYFYPFRPCLRCGGSGRNKGSTRKRFGTCRACGGAGHRQRLGSRFVHHTVLSVAAERRRAREKRAREKGQL